MWEFDAALVTAGALTGLLIGLTGVGGGSVMTPILLLIFGVAPTAAVGTDLWFAAVTKTVATRIHHQAGLIDWQIVRRLWWGSLPASALTLVGMRIVQMGAGASASLKVGIGCVVIVTATAMFFQKQLHALGEHMRVEGGESFKRWQRPLTIAAGALLGALVTLTSIGAGAIGVVLLTYLYPFRLTPSRLVATDIVHAVPLALFAGLGHLLLGNVDFGLLANLLIGSVPAVILGATLSSRLPQSLLRASLAAILVFTGYKLIGASAGH